MRKVLFLFTTLFLVAIFSQNIKAQTISSMVLTADTMCNYHNIRVQIVGCVPGLTATISYGDGTTSTNSISCSGSFANTMFSKNYPGPGTYTVKTVLSSASGPIDSVISSETIYKCRFMPVYAYNDVNMNCVKDAGEGYITIGIPLEVDSAGITIDTVSMLRSIYYRGTGIPGTIYRFRPLLGATGLAISCPATGYIYDTIPPLYTDTIPRKGFGIYCTGISTPDLTIPFASFIPAILGTFANRATISAGNATCASALAIMQFDFSPKYTFGSIIPATISHTVTGTRVTIDAGMVSNISNNEGVYVKLIPVVPLVMGDTVNSMFTVIPVTGETNTANNVIVRCDTIRASYDPNHKSVIPTGNISAGTKLEYMLEFENLGNDTAYNVHILDTISDYLDFNSIEFGVSTHNVSVVQLTDWGRNVLKFDFPNIKLWDSSHHDMNKGAVTFSINAKNTLSPGTKITNRVGIYFDTNPVVMTNTVVSPIPLPTGVSNMKITAVELYPNPVSDQLHINADNSDYTMLTIYNVVGQSVRTQDVNGDSTTVDVSSLVPGIYYVTLKGQAGSKTIKFEKQ